MLIIPQVVVVAWARVVYRHSPEVHDELTVMVESRDEAEAHARSPEHKNNKLKFVNTCTIRTIFSFNYI